jgi:hypothetical protein
MLANEGIAAVVALGTDWLAVRIDRLPPGIETDDEPHPGWLFTRDDWYILSLVQSQLSGADYARTMGELVASALSYVGSRGKGSAPE